MTEDGGKQQVQPKPGQAPAAVSAAGGRPTASTTQPLAGTAQQQQQRHQHSPAASGLQGRVNSATGATAARLPQAMTAQQRLNIRSMLATTFHREGLRGLYHGIGPTLVGIVPYAGLKFYVYQVCLPQPFASISDIVCVSCCAIQLGMHLHARHMCHCMPSGVTLSAKYAVWAVVTLSYALLP